ncbi:prokaryotic membrane lipolipid attachment site family protein [Neisseria chenwenguii]|uniref:Prokaryotic membrane lipolipid attachment site family protein n=2 Tax=Neisseria chenwenguii TaxID=1853278 RepID=A0A220S4Q2_9NEIS|nr:prokaryotic membrane lipolipid attachment site family protein [Neisseria chenwenguii]ASK28402.1 prokaryotic membrane lipolipid attachment site family protein [Neisseria chenwenguii]ROV56338.1 prokaryotic membrane lipolipid attachment site family protein [Neisseria chenwenguii]
MKKQIILLSALAALAGCETLQFPMMGEVPLRPTNVKPKPVPSKGKSSEAPASFRLASSHWSDVSKIRDEATRLSYQVSQGKLTKVQAAQYLNRFRIQQVGRNSVDDSMYEVYLRSAVDSQRGEITTEQSKLYIQNALKGWQQRWKNMNGKPDNPAFTNFLMEVMRMSPLQ